MPLPVNMLEGMEEDWEGQDSLTFPLEFGEITLKSPD